MRRLSVFFLLLGAVPLLHGDVQVLDFEGLPDSTLITNQYPGIFFTNAIAYTAGDTLNDFDFPPHSGTSVAFDYTGPMSIAFSLPVVSFSGYFTYFEPLTLQAYDASGDLLDTVVSSFSSNLANGDGDPGSSPNEFLDVSSASFIATVVITGDPGGTSFSLDDATITTSTATATPEPSSLAGITMLVLMGAFVRRRALVDRNSEARR
jgi:hypothetical protein